MSKGTEKEKRIIAMAYFHRYGWIAAMMACIAIWPKQMLLIFSVACLSFSVWSFIGYKKKWKHIYCSFQNSYHQKMTPNNIQWHKVKKSDAYGVPLIFLIIGLALLVIMILYSQIPICRTEQSHYFYLLLPLFCSVWLLFGTKKTTFVYRANVVFFRTKRALRHDKHPFGA